MFRGCIRLFSVIAALALFGTIPIGCVDSGRVTEAAQVGSKQALDIGGVTNRNTAPNTLTGVDQDGSMSIAAVGPVSQTEITTFTSEGKDGIAERVLSRAGSSASHRAVIPIPGSTRSIVTDTQAGTVAKVAKLYDGVTGNLLMEGLELEVDPATPIRAQNEAYDRLAAAWTTVPPESAKTVRDVLIKALEEERAKVEAITPTAGGVLTQAIELIAGL